MGPADARVMLVGEAPGRQEDLRGEPFVGRAGHFLDELLALVGLTRADVYITNVVKSRPFVGPAPGRNRTPAAEEIQACRGWLDDQLRIIQPEIVVAMGRTALEYFLPGRKISAVHGRAIPRGNLMILALFHPAVAVRRRDLGETLRRDFLNLRRLMRAGRPRGTDGRGKERRRRAQNTPS